MCAVEPLMSALPLPLESLCGNGFEMGGAEHGQRVEVGTCLKLQNVSGQRSHAVCAILGLTGRLNGVDHVIAFPREPRPNDITAFSPDVQWGLWVIQ